MDKDKILNRLNDITSHYSFGRILGMIHFKEKFRSGKSKFYDNRTNSQRLINTEINFLAGLWLNNIDLDKKNWEIDRDATLACEVYYLMNQLHLCYKSAGFEPNGLSFSEIMFYEGDPVYDFQCINVVSKKYALDKNYLLQNFKFDVDIVADLYSKLFAFIQKQFKERIIKKRKTNEHVSFINLFSIKEKHLAKYFSEKERNILLAVTASLGAPTNNVIKGIGDRNIFVEKPIVRLFEGNLFIPNLFAVACALNEAPYYWMINDESYRSKGLKNRGCFSESFVEGQLKEIFQENSVYIGIKVGKNKTRQITDIDVLLLDEDVAVVFQVKSKRLSLLSKQGSLSNIFSDFTKAIGEAYEQGVKSINCLKNYSDFTFSKSIDGIDKIKEYYNVCIVIDPYPSITSKSVAFMTKIMQDDVSLIAMSSFDLDTIIEFLGKENFVKYIKFRSQVSNKYSVINEIDYLAYFLEVGYKVKYPEYEDIRYRAKSIDEWYFKQKNK